MIPEFNDDGYLPPGVHPADVDEARKRSGSSSEIRTVQMESVEWLVDTARRAGVLRIVINGSFVTDMEEPNDVDCLLLVDEHYPIDESAVRELRNARKITSLFFAR